MGIKDRVRGLFRRQPDYWDAEETRALDAWRELREEDGFGQLEERSVVVRAIDHLVEKGIDRRYQHFGATAVRHAVLAVREIYAGTASDVSESSGADPVAESISKWLWFRGGEFETLMELALPDYFAEPRAYDERPTPELIALQLDAISRNSDTES